MKFNNFDLRFYDFSLSPQIQKKLKNQVVLKKKNEI